MKQHNTKSPHGYNLTNGGEGVVGRPMTKEDKEVRRKASIAFVASLSQEERSAKFGIKGRKLTTDHVEKIRQSLLGRKMPESEKPKHASFLGRKHTEETKLKISASNIAAKALLKAKKLAEQGVENA